MNKLQDRPLVKKKKSTVYKSIPYNSKSSSIYRGSVDLIYTIPSTQKKREVKTRLKRRTHTIETFICYGLGCLAVGGVIGLFSSLLGHTLLEQTRRDQIRIKEKVIYLKREIGHLKGKIDEVKYHENIDRWAESRGMINDRLIQPKIEEMMTPNALKDAYVVSF